MNPMTSPPPVIGLARVLEYAATDDLAFTGAHVPVAAGRELGAVPRLAIGERLTTRDVVLLYCDPAWDLLAVSAQASVADARRVAEEAYPGINGRWRAGGFSDADVEAYLDEEDRGMICSFCGRHPHQVEKMITGHNGAAICEVCIRALRDSR
jgi:hypothetical protein